MSITQAALLVALLAVVVGGSLLARAWYAWRQKRLITCPENEKPAAVRVDALKAALARAGGRGALSLSECSRWPEKNDCGQECLRQIERGPAECLVRTLVARWYEDRTCTCCGKAIRDVAWADQRPGLRAPDGTFVAWPDVSPESLPDLFKTHEPVCWNCLVVQQMVRRDPDAVTVRPQREQLYS
jgi:hypothetical protein